MHPKTPRWLEDITDEAGFVLDEAAGRTLAEYEADRRLRYAIERSFEIIGEALARIERTDPTTAGRITEHRKIIGFRNRLAHGYDLTDHALVWQVIEEQLPTLKREVEELLEEVSPPTEEA